MDEDGTTDPARCGAGGLSRRSVLGKAAAAGGAAWAAPALLSSAAHAQGSTPTTTGGGATFSPVSLGGFDGSYVAVDAAGHVRLSTDAGASWADPLDGGTVPTTPVGAGRFSVVFAVYGSLGIMVSSDGSMWGTFLGFPYPPGFTAAVAAPTNCVLASSSGAIARSLFVGSSLALTLVTPVDISPAAIAITSPSVLVGGVLIVVDATGTVRVSADGGTTWSDPSGGEGVGLAPVAVLGDDTGGGLFGVASATGQWRASTDGGATWSDRTSIGINPVAVAGRANQILAVDGAGNLRTSTDGGFTWTAPAGSPII